MAGGMDTTHPYRSMKIKPTIKIPRNYGRFIGRTVAPILLIGFCVGVLIDNHYAKTKTIYRPQIVEKIVSVPVDRVVEKEVVKWVPAPPPACLDIIYNMNGDYSSQCPSESQVMELHGTMVLCRCNRPSK